MLLSSCCRSLINCVFKSCCCSLQRKEALKELGRQQRHDILRQHRHSLTPMDLKVPAANSRLPAAFKACCWMPHLACSCCCCCCCRASSMQTPWLPSKRSCSISPLKWMVRGSFGQPPQHHGPCVSPAVLSLPSHSHAHAQPSSLCAAVVLPSCTGGVLTEADIDALLADIEQQVMQEIQAELAELERQEQEQVQHAASMAEQHMHHLQQHAAQGSDVLCPVCKSCHLVQRAGLLVCPAEGWRLNLAAESLSLDDVRARLAAVYQVRLCLCSVGDGVAGCSRHQLFLDTDAGVPACPSPCLFF